MIEPSAALLDTLSRMTPAERLADLRSKNRAAQKAELESHAKQRIVPEDMTAAAGNDLRPDTWDEVIGQEHAKSLLRRMVATAKAQDHPLDHVLFVGRSGTGKTTLAHVIAHDLGARVFQLEAPVSADTLMELSEVMNDGDILFLDEIHQQAVGDRRGRSSSTQPEVLFSIMEDFTMPTPYGIIEFPRITFMGATTDEGALPDAFINRFPIRPRMEQYSVADMEKIALKSATRKGLTITRQAAHLFATASRGIPREVNNFIRNCTMLGAKAVTPGLASEVVHDLNGYTDDGLTPDMQAMLKFLLRRARREKGNGEVVYQASVGSIATAIGKSRDVKAIQLRVEPYLIEQGLIQVLHGGRALTDSGVERAMNLIRLEAP